MQGLRLTGRLDTGEQMECGMVCVRVTSKLVVCGGNELLGGTSSVSR